MAQRKSYGQFCGLARSLDRIGDRWSLLIVRELLLDDRTFRELQAALQGISPSLLSKRLTELVHDGLVARNQAPRRSKSVEYRLTDAGRALEPVVLEMIRWGSRWMVEGPGDDHIDPRWSPLALRALLDGKSSRQGTVHLDIEGVDVTVRGAAGRRSVRPGRHGEPDATVAAPFPVILAIATHGQPLHDADTAVSGDGVVASDLLTPREGDAA